MTVVSILHETGAGGYGTGKRYQVHYFCTSEPDSKFYTRLD
jgi:hypothetical protein